MTQIAFEHEVMHSPEQMFELASDLSRYPSFVPNCDDMEIKDLPQKGQCLARMHISFGPIEQSYESKVHADREHLEVTATSDDDPFSHLKSIWRFTPLESGGTHVKFCVDFKMRNRLIAAVAEPLFSQKQREIVDAFMAEADRRYANSR